jgi:hypothetical protein
VGRAFRHKQRGYPLALIADTLCIEKSLALWIHAMTTIDEIKAAIDHLSLSERAEVAR